MHHMCSGSKPSDHHAIRAAHSNMRAFPCARRTTARNTQVYAPPAPGNRASRAFLHEKRGEFREKSGVSICGQPANILLAEAWACGTWHIILSRRALSKRRGSTRSDRSVLRNDQATGSHGVQEAPTAGRDSSPLRCWQSHPKRTAASPDSGQAWDAAVSAPF